MVSFFPAMKQPSEDQYLSFGFVKMIEKLVKVLKRTETNSISMFSFLNKCITTCLMRNAFKRKNFTFDVIMARSINKYVTIKSYELLYTIY